MSEVETAIMVLNAKAPTVLPTPVVFAAPTASTPSKGNGYDNADATFFNVSGILTDEMDPLH